jgi:hypothetical protein
VPLQEKIVAGSNPIFQLEIENFSILSSRIEGNLLGFGAFGGSVLRRLRRTPGTTGELLIESVVLRVPSENHSAPCELLALRSRVHLQRRRIGDFFATIVRFLS